MIISDHCLQMLCFRMGGEGRRGGASPWLRNEAIIKICKKTMKTWRTLGDCSVADGWSHVKKTTYHATVESTNSSIISY